MYDRERLVLRVIEWVEVKGFKFDMGWTAYVVTNYRFGEKIG